MAETLHELKRVGKSGQISIGKERAGQLYREQVQDDGTIILTPVVVLAADHWTVRDGNKIVNAMAWAAESSARATSLDALIAKAAKKKSGR